MDNLERVLSLLRIKPSVYFRHDFSAPWGMAMDTGPFAVFHVVARGHCILRLGSDSQAHTLSAGDIVLLPHGTAHALLSDLDSDTVPGPEVVAAYQRKQPMFNGASPSVELVCGHFDYDRASTWQPFLQSLPELIYVPAVNYGKGAEATAIAKLLTNEMGTGLGGEGLVAAKLAEALFVMTLRAYSQLADPDRGFLAAAQDPRVGRALALIHDVNGRHHSLEALAEAVGMSRSAFAQRFRELLGLSPIAYADSWRLLRARSMLQGTSLSIGEIAGRSGYESEAAFHRAFKREFNVTPGQVRVES